MSTEEVRIRPATSSDFEAISNIAVEAHRNDEKFAYLFPKRDVHIEAYRKYFLTHAKHHSIIPGCFVIVAEVTPSDGKSRVVGYCLWNHEIDNEDNEKSQEEGGTGGQNRVQALLHRFTTSMTAYYISMLLNPAASLRHNLQLGNDDEHFKDPSYEEPSHSWGINELAVAPEFQRRGIGMRLLRWGMDHAVADNVPVTLASTPAGTRLYEKAGFYVYGTWKWAKEATETYLLMRWDPPMVV